MYENNIQCMSEVIQNYECIKTESRNIGYILQNDNKLLDHSKEQIFLIENYIKQLKDNKIYCESKINKLCNHEIINDTIDIDTENSQNINYCRICEKTFN